MPIMFNPCQPCCKLPGGPTCLTIIPSSPLGPTCRWFFADPFFAGAFFAHNLTWDGHDWVASFFLDDVSLQQWRTEIKIEGETGVLVATCFVQNEPFGPWEIDGSSSLTPTHVGSLDHFAPFLEYRGITSDGLCCPGGPYDIIVGNYSPPIPDAPSNLSPCYRPPLAWGRMPEKFCVVLALLDADWATRLVSDRGITMTYNPSLGIWQGGRTIQGVYYSLKASFRSSFYVATTSTCPGSLHTQSPPQIAFNLQVGAVTNDDWWSASGSSTAPPGMTIMPVCLGGQKYKLAPSFNCSGALGDPNRFVRTCGPEGDKSDTLFATFEASGGLACLNDMEVPLARYDPYPGGDPGFVPKDLWGYWSGEVTLPACGGCILRVSARLGYCTTVNSDLFQFTADFVNPATSLVESTMSWPGGPPYFEMEQDTYSPVLDLIIHFYMGHQGSGPFTCPGNLTDLVRMRVTE